MNEKKPDPEAIIHAQPIPPIQVVCPECGDLLEVRDVYALVQAIHLNNACPATAPILGGQ